MHRRRSSKQYGKCLVRADRSRSLLNSETSRQGWRVLPLVISLSLDLAHIRCTAVAVVSVSRVRGGMRAMDATERTVLSDGCRVAMQSAFRSTPAIASAHERTWVSSSRTFPVQDTIESTRPSIVLRLPTLRSHAVVLCRILCK
jgi:hypothetical protein